MRSNNAINVGDTETWLWWCDAPGCGEVMFSGHINGWTSETTHLPVDYKQYLRDSLNIFPTVYYYCHTCNHKGKRKQK